MYIKTYYKFFILFSFFMYGCASYKLQYKNADTSLKNDTEENSSEEIYSLYFIGDAGNADKGEDLEHFTLLKKELETVSENSKLLFLGDNLYEKGMPEKEDEKRALAEHRLDAQINIVKNYKGEVIFIPGNHDYYNNGIEGLKREANYVTKHLNNKNAFLPQDGCPFKKIAITDDVILLIVDSQWFLEDWNKNPTMNDDCDIKTRELFFEEYESYIKKNADKVILVAIHHPMYSYGSHGGQYSVKSQFKPTDLVPVPVPILGTMANIFRRTSGISTQDMNNALYRELKNRIITLSQKADKLVFISGHEHNLQFIQKDNLTQIVSGSGSKQSAVRLLNGSEFCYGNLGYSKISIHKNGSVWVYFYSENKGEKELLFKKEIFQKNKATKQYQFTNSIPDSTSLAIYNNAKTTKNKLYKAFWGTHYRTYYSTKVSAKNVLLDTLFGGLTPVREGGGHQSRSIRLETENGKEYVMRALKKSASQYIQAVAFKNKYVEGQFENTLAEELLMDIYTTAHPYTPFVVGKLSDAVGVFHTNPKLYYVPKQTALQQYNENYGNELYMIEERAADGHKELESFGFSNNLISTNDLLLKLRKTDDNQIDEASYIRARLFDMLIGDWDRHYDQWRWAEFKEGKKTIYKPVPRDRDQAFSKWDGLILGFLTRSIPALKLMQVYDDDIRNVKWFNVEPYPLDVALLSNATYKDWETQVAYIQQNLTEKAIDDAFNQLPKEVNDYTITDIKKKLNARLQNLPKIAEKYYKNVERIGIIKGTDKDNWFDIERLKNGNTSVKVFNIKKNEKGSLLSEKTFSNKHTKEIWVYGLDDDDMFNVYGNGTKNIPLKIIGGQNNDSYTITNGKNVTVYDYKSKKNTFNTSNGKIKLTDDYETNTYNYKKVKYNENLILPSIGSNPDDGFRIGIKNIYTTYKFNRNPFTQQHTLTTAHYFATKGLDISYKGEFAHVFSNWNFLVEARYTTPNYSLNFYGMGNETKNYEDDFGEDYHRVKLSIYAFKPSFKWKGRLSAEIQIGPTYESVEVENTVNRYINTIPNRIEDRQNYIGTAASYFYENYDDKASPTLGMRAEISTGFKTNLDKNNETTGYFTPAFSFNYPLISNGKIVFASKMKGNIIIGNYFEFYNAASIGGLDGLRGYRNQRFSGDKSFYQNSDIRFHIKNAKTRLIPLEIGLLAGFDYGRVWLNNDHSKNWKTSYGAGFWMVGAEMLNLNISVFNSNDGAYVNFGLGFGF